MAFGLGAALLGGSILGAGASLFGASKQSKAVSNAADEAAAVQREALGLQRDAMGLARQDLAPYREVGVPALGAMQNAAGVNGPAGHAQALQDFQASPGYQFQFDEGMRAVNAGAAAQGMSNSGATLKALQARGQQLANQDFSQYYNRLAGLAQIGQASAAGTASAGIQSANAQGNILGGMANTAASLGTAQANITGGMIGGVTGALNNGLNNYVMMNSLYNPRAAGAVR